MTSTTTSPVTTTSISRAAAAELIAVARSTADNLGTGLAIAVTGASGHLRAFSRTPRLTSASARQSR